MIIKEFRVILPVTVEEYQIGQLYQTAERSKNETGGGEGIEIVTNEPFSAEPLFQGGYAEGQHTSKIFHMQSKVPRMIRALAPSGALEVFEEAHNAYPYCRTVITNPYMADNFVLRIESLHLADNGETENAHCLSPAELAQREVIIIDIANDPVAASDYKIEEDPTKFHSEKTGRGPLGGTWRKDTQPIMCCYKLVKCEFKWFGLQTAVESRIMKAERRLFTSFGRQVFCTLDKWHGMTMDDIRKIEDETKRELDQLRKEGQVRGMVEK